MNQLPKAYEPADIEKKWYPLWENRGYFHSDPNSGKPPYSIVIPPPNVTGILTLGHVLNNTLQDILIRYYRMRGYEVCWFPGTDHAGIATESKVDKYLRAEEKICRDDLGREEFIRRVWQWKEQYGGKIIRQLRTLGCSCDWQRERFTMDEGLSDAVRKVFVELYRKGYIYRGQRIINYCPVAKTALSDEEVIYKDVAGKFWHFRYPLADGSGKYLVVATTRPETMFGDTAVAVNPSDERYRELIGKEVMLPLCNRPIPIVGDEHADPAKGSGCVKITPAHDPNDFQVGLRHHLKVINVMNADASLNASVPAEFVGLDRYAARDLVVRRMEELGLLEKVEDIRHAVGYSERGDVPIETIVSSQWFCRMKELAAPAVEAVESGRIKFHPERWAKTYFHWMENIQDWCISRQIWWGHRIPAWYNDANGEVYVGMEPPTAPGQWRQETDVLDTWFSSWLWPFSIMGWPQKTVELEKFYPTNALVTGPDIIFFWVARMIMAGCEFMKEIPFRDVYFTSIIRDDKGRKLSKSLGNSPDPLDVIATYGADALRFSIIYIAPVGMDIQYSNDKCELGRNFANKLWNACRFRQLQGPVSENYLSLPPVTELSSDEQWMLAKLDFAVESSAKAIEQFRFHSAAHDIYELVWSTFCDWFIEAEKQPLRGDAGERARALRVLDYALDRILRILHAFMPFITEELAHAMGFLEDDQSIMFAQYPEKSGLTFDEGAVKLVDGKFELVRQGRALKANCSIPDGKKVSFYLKAHDARTAEFLKAEQGSIAGLLNAERLEIGTDEYDPAAKGAAPSLLGELGTIYLPLAGVIDVEAEKAKLNAQRTDLAGKIAGASARLSNEKFVSKAPEAVVTEARRQLEEMRSKLERVETLLRSFV
ncbi:MAG: valine--tRNA ligase [Victivallaceae bacterium]|nr:valine--tRNA ligase [Victivallaceae bacterium]